MADQQSGPNQQGGKENEQPDAYNPPKGQGAQNEPAGEDQRARSDEGDRQANIPGSTQDGDSSPD
jgi:hypothetical protein